MRILKCAFAYNRFDCPEVTQCGRHDIKIQLVLQFLHEKSTAAISLHDFHCFILLDFWHLTSLLMLWLCSSTCIASMLRIQYRL